LGIIPVTPSARRILVSTAVLGILYGTAGLWGVPKAARHAISAYARDHRHTVRIGAVRFNPITLTLHIEDLEFATLTGVTDLNVSDATLALGWDSLIGGGLDVKSAQVHVARVRVARLPDGTWNLAALVPQTDPQSPWPTVRIQDAVLQLADLSVDERGLPGGAWHIPSATLSGAHIDTRLPMSTWRLSVATDRGEALSAVTQLTLSPLHAQSALSVTNLDLARLTDSTSVTGAAQIQGRLNLRGTVDWSADHPAAIALRDADLDGVSLQLTGRGEPHATLSVPRWSLTQLHYDSSNGRAGFANLTVHAPQLTLPGGAALPAFSSDPHAPTPPSSAARWTIGRIGIEDGQCDWVDVSRPQPVHWQIGGFAATVDTPGDGGRRVQATAGVGAGGRVAVTGRIGSDLTSADLTVHAEHLSVTQLDPYVESLIALRVDTGWWSAQGEITLNRNDWHYVGSATVDDLRTTDTGRQHDFIGVDHLQIDGMDAHWPEIAIHLRSVTANAPYANVRVAANGQSNLGSLMPASGKGGATTLPPLVVDTLTIASGRLYFADESQTPSFEAGIADLAGQMTGLSSDANTRAHLAFSGHVDRYAPVSIEGDANLIADPVAADVHMHFDNLEMTGLSPYSGRFAGYTIRKGKASADLVYHVADHRVNASHHVRLNQFELGDRVEGQSGFGVPLGLVVALLRDSNGNIDLDVPLSGSFDDPNFSLSRLTQKVVGNLFRKMISSPFALLGSLFGGGEEISRIDFPAGAIQPDPESRERLRTLARAMAARPQVSIDIPIAAAPTDAAALGEQRYQSILLTRARERFGDLSDVALQTRLANSSNDRQTVLMAVLGLTQTVADVGQLEAQARTATAPNADDLEQLATGRAQAVQSALIEGNSIDPARVFLVRGPKAVASGSSVELKLALH
jgi:Domain of Unknown Function (DUF748)